MLMIVPSTLLCEQASDLWQQDTDLQDTVDWGRKWLADFSDGKLKLVSFDWSNNTGTIDVKMDGSVLDSQSYFEILGLSLSSKFIVCIGVSSPPFFHQAPP